DGGRDSALQEHRFALFSELAEKVVVLHVARADLEDIRVGREQRNLGVVHDLADDEQFIAIGGLPEQAQSFLTQTLKTIGRAARFEGASADHPGARFSHDLRDALDLIPGFHAARAGHHDDGGAADSYPTDFDYRS